MPGRRGWPGGIALTASTLAEGAPGPQSEELTQPPVAHAALLLTWGPLASRVAKPGGFLRGPWLFTVLGPLAASLPGGRGGDSGRGGRSTASAI